jgi:ubiquitin-like-conjugating enzyme ATG3
VDSAANPGEIDDIPDLDGDGLASAMADVSMVSESGATVGETPDLDDIPDMEEEGLEDGEDEATAAPVVPKAGGAIDAS